MEGRQRSPSPTVQLWDARSQARERIATMVGMGLHVFNPEWQYEAVATRGLRGKMYSTSFRETTVQIHGSEESLTFPVQTCTKVRDVKEALASSLVVSADTLVFVVRQGCTWRQQADCEEVGRRVVLKGVRTFKRLPHKWPHPIGIIGTGYQGLKCSMLYLKSGNTNITLFDRHDRVGGYCWIDAANKTSKIQTEFASFHVWGGHELMKDPLAYPSDQWGTWPNKAKILEHFQWAAEEYGVLPYCNFSCNVEKMDVEGERGSEHRSYNLDVRSLRDSRDKQRVTVSVMYNFPGSMTTNRLVTYAGEDIFDGQIGYGMNDDCPYQHLQGSHTAIVGNGAFAVEAIRTCCEYQVEKTYLVTRRKNLASPRLCCWFAHQSVVPMRAALLVKMFEPMYEAAGFGDPWDFWSVHANSSRDKVTIIQQSRFGIGDVTFLALAYGKAEYVEDTIKRLSRHTLHLLSGRKLENVTNIIKSLGLLGDFAVDRLHKMKRMVGSFCDGDWRRVLLMDAPGMNASNFATFSVLGSIGFSRDMKFLHDFPADYRRMQDAGLLDQLPVNKASDELDKPAYVYDVKYHMSATILLESMCPKLQELGALDGEYKHKLYHALHPLDKFMRECQESWDEYQRVWKEQGSTREYLPYPYTPILMMKYFEEYSKDSGMLVFPSGPPKDQLSMSREQLGRDRLGEVPNWGADDGAVSQAMRMKDGEYKAWWTHQGHGSDLFLQGRTAAVQDAS